MSKEELEYFKDETLMFTNIDEAFEDFCWEMSAEDIMKFISDEEKERIISTSPSYVKHNNKYFFNSNFQDSDLTEEELNKILDEKDREA